MSVIVVFRIFRQHIFVLISDIVGKTFSFDRGVPLNSSIRTAFAAFSLFWFALSAVAQDTDAGGYFSNWFKRVNRTQAAQPHWITPLFTTTPRLEEEFRSDITWTPSTAGTDLNYGAGKGLELIPTEHTEIIAGVPPYQAPASGQSGFGNIPLTLKYRFLAGNEERGNYIVTAFLSGSIPYGR